VSQLAELECLMDCPITDGIDEMVLRRRVQGPDHPSFVEAGRDSHSGLGNLDLEAVWVPPGIHLFLPALSQ